MSNIVKASKQRQRLITPTSISDTITESRTPTYNYFCLILFVRTKQILNQENHFIPISLAEFDPKKKKAENAVALFNLMTL